MKIFLSVGHNSRNGGASYFGTNEYREVSAIVKEVSKSNLPSVVYVPHGSIKSKVEWLNLNMKKDDIMIELHMDAGKWNSEGAMCYYNRNDKHAKIAAEKILKQYCKSGMDYRYVKEESKSRYGKLGMIRDLKNPSNAFILELGFISSSWDLSFMKHHSANGIVRMLKYLSLKTNVKVLRSKIYVLKQALNSVKNAKYYSAFNRALTSIYKKMKKLIG